MKTIHSTQISWIPDFWFWFKSRFLFPIGLNISLKISGDADAALLSLNDSLSKISIRLNGQRA